MTAAAEVTASHRVGLRSLMTLLGGRATFRLLLYGSAGVLVAAWSGDDFNRYSAAMGATGWLCMVVQSGPEKAALRLIPRARRTREQLAGMLRAILAYVPIPFAMAAAAGLVLAPDSMATIYLLGTAYYISLGCGMLGVAVHRALGHYTPDTVHFSLLGLGMLAVAGLAFAVPIRPAGYLAGLLVLSTVLNLVLLRGLPRTAWPPHRALRRVLAGTVVLMGTADVMSNAMVGALFVELALTSHAGQSGDLYVLILGWGFTVSVIYTLQRIYQPRLSLRLASGGAAEARALGRRIARLSVWMSAGWLVLAGVALLGGLAGSRSLLALGGLLLSLLPVYLLTSFGIFMLENTDEAGLRNSAKAAVAALVAVIALGAVVIPLAGAAGAVYALGANGFVLGLVLRRVI